MNDSAKTIAEARLLIVDLAKGKVAEIEGPNLSAFTERHHIVLPNLGTLRAVADVEAALARHSCDYVVLVLEEGLPSRSFRRMAAKLLGAGRNVYFYWPREGALEVVDRHRLASLERHAAFLRGLSFLRSGRERASAAARVPIGVANKIAGGLSTYRSGGGIAATAAGLPRRALNKFVYLGQRQASTVMRRHELTDPVEEAGKMSSVLRTLNTTTAINVRRRVAAERRLTDLVEEAAKMNSVLRALNTPTAIKVRRRAAAERILGERQLENGTLPSMAEPLDGPGAYVRLDYWAKLKTGGSYGHTCFLANSAARVTRDFECIMANRYDLLDTLGLRQHVLQHDFQSATSGDLIVHGARLSEPVAKALDALRPSFVYERSVLGSTASAQWCLTNDVPYIVEYNGSELAMARSFGTPYELDKELETIEEFGLKAATLINVISDPVADSLIERGIPAEKILVNPNAVDPDTYRAAVGADRAAKRAKRGLEADDIVVGFCGTFGGWHGIEVLAASMPRICAADPKIKFLLIGDGNLKHLVREVVAAHGLEKQVVDLGLVPQLDGAEALSICDILLSPHAQNIDGKTFFGSPTKLFEYLAVEAAVVASDLAQIGEIMRPSLTIGDLRAANRVTDHRGVLVKPGSADELVEAVTLLARSPECRRALARNARKAVLENYTWDIHVENIWRALANLPLKGYTNDRLKRGSSA